jgi:orotidine-5'-phosphate decarboxylase
MTSPIFLALDLKDLTEATNKVMLLKDYLFGVKLGMEFFYANGKEGYLKIKSLGLPIFLDLKIHDIPNTTYAAILSLSDIAPDFISVHGCSDRAALEKAKEASIKTGIKLLAVTELTSSMHQNVYERASICLSHGFDGIICSGNENRELRKRFGNKFLIVNPAIRPRGISLDDQKRISTPKSAINDGANYLVIGRPILNSADPINMVRTILEEIK